MYCPDCGTPNGENNTFCTSCGFAFHNLEAPQASNTQAPPTQQSAKQRQINTHARPYKAEFVVGLIGSIFGIAIFQLLLITGISWEADQSGTGFAVIISSLLVLFSFILGFIGVSRLNKGISNGGFFLIAGGVLGLIAMLLDMPVTIMTILFFPILLTSGFIVLARKSVVERNCPPSKKRR